MKRTTALLIFIAFTANAQAQEGAPAVAVETVDGHKVVLRGVDVERRDGGADVHGWVRREPGRMGAIYAHLHVEAFDAAGVSLGVSEGRWFDTLSVRDRSSSPFHVELTPNIAARLDRVRVSIEAGARHHQEEAEPS